MRGFIRSLSFNIVFYSYTVVWCFLLMWAFLLPRAVALKAVTVYFRGITVVERIFLGLNYRVTGLENLPADGRYILAMKHQSAYETLKLLPIFGDIAIILKRELTWIPFWGWYTIKTGMIPVDRGARGKAMASMIEGGKRVMAEGRPIIIFPQGTRVKVGQTPAEKPYKIGVVRLAEALGVPIVPVALNSGVFWAKHAFIKYGGVSEFKILPAIPRGLTTQETMAHLQNVLERESDALAANAEMRLPGRRRFPLFLTLLVVLALLWTAWWYTVAAFAQKQIDTLTTQDFNGTRLSSPYKPELDGFPFALRLTWPTVTVTSPTSTLEIGVIEAHLWPLPAAPADIYAASTIRYTGQQNGRVVDLSFDTASIKLRLPKVWEPRAQWGVTITDVGFTRGVTQFESRGSIAVPLDPQTDYTGSMDMKLAGHGDLIDALRDQALLQDNIAGMARGFLDTLAFSQGGGALSVPLTINDNWVYVGPIRAFNLRSEAVMPEAVPIQNILPETSVEPISAVPAIVPKAVVKAKAAKPEVKPGSAPIAEFVMPPPQNRPVDSGSSSTLDLNPQMPPARP